MSTEVRTELDFRRPILVDGAPGSPEHVIVSQGVDDPPKYEPRKKWIKSTIEPTGQLEGYEWFNPDTGVNATWVVTASGGKWVELGPPGSGLPGVGIPAGGTTGQKLAKIDSTDYNTGWADDITIPALMALSEAEAGSATTARTISPNVLADAIYYHGELILINFFDAKFDIISTGGDEPIGRYGITSGGYLERTDSVTATSGIIEFNTGYYNHVTFVSPINGATNLVFEPLNLEDLRAAPYTWIGTIRFTYTSGAIDFFSTSASYTVIWEEGTQPTFLAGKTYTVRVVVIGTLDQIRLTLIDNNSDKVSGSVRLTVGSTAPPAPAENDIWVDTTGLV